jgi:hypothetical protein
MFELKEGCEAVSVRSIPGGSWCYMAPAVYVVHRGKDGVLRWKCKDARPCGTFFHEKSGRVLPIGWRTRKKAEKMGRGYASEIEVMFVPGLRHGKRVAGR